MDCASIALQLVLDEARSASEERWRRPISHVTRSSSPSGVDHARIRAAGRMGNTTANDRRHTARAQRPDGVPFDRSAMKSQQHVDQTRETGRQP